MKSMPLGPLMIDIVGTELTDLDRERLCHPLVGGIILFSRNFSDVAQLEKLTAEIHGLRSPRLLIAVDHEGGRVQRFREGFTRLPAMSALGAAWEQDAESALNKARQVGYVLAAELRARGVDLSFTPVLDLDYGCSTVIGARSFHRRPEVVARLAGALIEGLRQAGMAACGKHFPGHGHVEADSHVAIPVDERSFHELQEDIAPYRQLVLDAVMPAHVTYPAVDGKTAGFSNVWINYLRNDVKFDGVIFSDDLSMEGASVVGGVVDRVEAAHRAGCDMLLLCNAPDSVGEVLEKWRPTEDAARASARSRRIENLVPATPAPVWPDLLADGGYQAAVQATSSLVA
ncbi:MAG TPA: beta-N-acetylhexosaminidase [Rhodocyclaceae bacterium]|nr:beta-N-acetylhexosaminidase [Rhodocyclaceae bacterium]